MIWCLQCFNTIQVDVNDYSLTTGNTSLPAGKVKMNNKREYFIHELERLKTSLQKDRSQMKEPTQFLYYLFYNILLNTIDLVELTLHWPIYLFSI